MWPVSGFSCFCQTVLKYINMVCFSEALVCKITISQPVLKSKLSEGVSIFKTCCHKPTVIRNGHSSRLGRTHQKCWVGHGRGQLSRLCLTIGSENSF